MTLPFREFIKVVVDDNLSALIISGMPPEEELQKAWKIIHAQYRDAIGGAEQEHYINVYKQVALISADYQLMLIYIPLIEQSINLKAYIPELYDEMNDTLRSSIRFSETDWELNEANLKKVKSRIKGIKINLDLKQLQLNDLVRQDNEKPTREHYKSILISLSDHAGFYLDENIMTYEFCERFKRMNSYMKKLNEKNGRK